MDKDTPAQKCHGGPGAGLEGRGCGTAMSHSRSVTEQQRQLLGQCVLYLIKVHSSLKDHSRGVLKNQGLEFLAEVFVYSD